jgi:hypothetical protein
MLWSFGGGLLLDMLGGKLEVRVACVNDTFRFVSCFITNQNSVERQMFYNNNNNNHNDNADVFVFNGRNPDMEKATRLYIETIGDIVKNITQTERSLRWYKIIVATVGVVKANLVYFSFRDVETVLKTLRSLFNRLEGKRCMTRWQWHIRSE